MNAEERFAGLEKSNVRKASRLDQDWRQVEDSALSCRALGSTVPGFLLSAGRPLTVADLAIQPAGVLKLYVVGKEIARGYRAIEDRSTCAHATRYLASRVSPLHNTMAHHAIKYQNTGR